MSVPTNQSPTSIQFVCQVFYPDQESTSQLFTDLLRELAGRGYHFHVEAGYPVAMDRRAAAELPSEEEIVPGLRVRRSGGGGLNKKSLASRLWRYLRYSGGVLRGLREGRRDTFVFGVTNPPFLPVLLWVGSILFRFRYQVMLHDVYPDGLVAVGMLKPKGLVSSFWRRLNRNALNRADRVLVLGRDMQQLVTKRYGVDPAKCHYIPHWSSYEPAEIRIAEETHLWSQLNLEKAFVVQYSGNMGLWHDMKTIVRAAKRVEDENPEVVFLLIGAGRRREEAEKLSVELGCGNIRWLPYQPKETLSDSLACCHVALISQRKGLEGVAVPCKVYGILAAGRPILGLVPEQSEVAEVIREEDCGMVVDPEDADAAASRILDLAADRERALAMGKRGFRAYQKKYTLGIAVEKFEELWK